VRAGEASGTLPDVLQRWGQWQADTLTEQWASGIRLIEPLLMGLLGLLMGWLVLALYMPVLQMGHLL
jgi:type II secretory pathway component PulF